MGLTDWTITEFPNLWEPLNQKFSMRNPPGKKGIIDSQTERWTERPFGGSYVLLRFG